MRKVACHFINIHQTNKWVPEVCLINLLDLKKMETSGFMDITALVGGK